MTRFFLIASTLLLSHSNLAAEQSATQRGKSLGNTTNSTYGSKDGISKKMSNPIMGKGQMTTMDGSKSFDAQMQCPASSKALGITFLSAGGNDYRLIIRQDTDLDKTFDYTYDTNVLGKTVSGICTNGVTMCSPAGSWTNCKPYTWDVQDKKIFLRESSFGAAEMGSCFCSNMSCGVSSLLQQMYENVGGGISATLMNKNPLFLHSKSEWSFAEMTYYLFGQNKENCTGFASTSWDKYGETNPSKNYTNQQPPSTSIADVAIEQGGDPNSYYSLLSEQNKVAYDKKGNKVSLPSKVSCVSSKSIVSKITTEWESCSPVGWNGQTWCVVGDRAAKNDVSLSGSSVSLKAGQSLYGIGHYNGSICDNDSSHVVLNFTGDKTGSLSLGCPSARSYGLAVVNNAEKNMNINITQFTQNHSGGGYDVYNISLYKSNSYQKETFSATISDNCPTDCELVDEQVCDNSGNNCVYTVRNGVKQTITPPKSCSTHSSSVSAGQYCADGNALTVQTNEGTQVLYAGSDAWFQTKKTYQCKSDDIALDVTKMTNTSQTATKAQESTMMSYVGLDGSSQAINNLPVEEKCPTPTCTIKKTEVDNVQYNDGTNKSQLAGGGTTYMSYVRTCIKDDATSAMTCPVDTAAGEKMTEACRCEGNMGPFQEAISTLKVVEEASKDMICSSKK